MGSFLYPRTIKIHRPAAQTGGGMLPYGGQIQANEAEIATGIPASIQEKREGALNPTRLPGDAKVPTHYVFIPRGKLANGTVKTGDIVIDDLEIRYQVQAPYWDSLGYRLSVITLEV